MKYLFVVVIGLIAYFTYNNSMKTEWSLFVYPNGDPSENSIISLNSYKSFEDCQGGYEDFSGVAFPNSEYECGYKCEVTDPSTKLYSCKETRD